MEERDCITCVHQLKHEDCPPCKNCRIQTSLPFWEPLVQNEDSI